MTTSTGKFMDVKITFENSFIVFFSIKNPYLLSLTFCTLKLLFKMFFAFTLLCLLWILFILDPTSILYIENLSCVTKRKINTKLEKFYILLQFFIKDTLIKGLLKCVIVRLRLIYIFKHAVNYFFEIVRVSYCFCSLGFSTPHVSIIF